MEEAEIATVGTKGQVVIPLHIRKELGITPKTKLAMYSRHGRLVAAKVEAPTLDDELGELFREVDQPYKGKKRPSEGEILAEILAYRKEKRSASGA
jgi:bifunctional DNA-binding transcriptional regulator/antitoxin component of YhaV-PrlF toxin-antitoxin module